MPDHEGLTAAARGRSGPEWTPVLEPPVPSGPTVVHLPAPPEPEGDRHWADQGL